MNTTSNQNQINDMSQRIAAHLVSANDTVIAETWTGTETGNQDRTTTAMVRGWVMDEIESRIGDDLFDEWLTANTPDPAPYLTRARKR